MFNKSEGTYSRATLKVLMKKTVSAFLISCISVSVFAQKVSEGQADPAVKSVTREVSSPKIITMSDLIRQLNDGSAENPLNKLSANAKSLLLNTITTNSHGDITSYRFTEIQQELGPTDAYNVLALFGNESLAAKINNGIVKTSIDAKILSGNISGVIKPKTDNSGYYCNGGYCTANSQMICNGVKCPLP